MKNPKVSIITVNYKQPKVTCELLDSIDQLTYPNLEVILVDNAQPFDDTELYKSHYEPVKVINVADNAGFAKGNNIGIESATGDYIFLLNNDTEVSNGLIEELISSFEGKPSIGAISPLIKYYDHPEKIQFAGFTEVSKYTGRNELIHEMPKDRLTNTAYFHGAAVMIPKSVISKCGLMPEEFFLYYEELDWSRMIKSQGYSIKVLSTVSILHKESISTGKNSPLKVYYQNRNRIHFMRKAAKHQYLVFLTYFLLLAAPKKLLIPPDQKRIKTPESIYQGVLSWINYQKGWVSKILVFKIKAKNQLTLIADHSTIISD